MSESLSCVRFNSSIAKVGVFNKTAIPYLHKSLNNMRDYNAILELAKDKAEREAQEKRLNQDYAEWFIRGYIEGFMLGYAEGCESLSLDMS